MGTSGRGAAISTVAVEKRRVPSGASTAEIGEDVGNGFCPTSDEGGEEAPPHAVSQIAQNMQTKMRPETVPILFTTARISRNAQSRQLFVSGVHTVVKYTQHPF
jgi:hypothetical protein